VDKFLWNLGQLRLKDKFVLVSGVPLIPLKVGCMVKSKGEIPLIPPDVNQIKGEMKSISALDFTGCGPKEGMKSISALDFAGYGPKGEMKSISALDFAGCGLKEGMKSISALDFTGDYPRSSLHGVV
jgi:hypothetical protein